jgi:hypothetical protein
MARGPQREPIGRPRSSTSVVSCGTRRFNDGLAMPKEARDQIHGKSISWEQLGPMQMSYEGFSFKLEVYDPTEERQPPNDR